MKDLKDDDSETEINEEMKKDSKETKKRKKTTREKIIEQNVFVKTQEIGPRLCLQLKDFYSGVFDSLEGKYEFHYRADYFVKRNNFFL